MFMKIFRTINRMADGDSGSADGDAAAAAATAGAVDKDTDAGTAGADKGTDGAAAGKDAAAAGKDGAGAGDAGTGKAKAGTIVSDGGSDKKTVAPADWPSDWRQKGMAAAGIAVDDKKTLAMLERLSSPGDLVKKVLEQEKVISSGAHKKGLAKDATAEQIAAYRKENNIPETPDKYDLALPDGLVIGAQDKPIVDALLGTMHGMNLSNDQVKQMLSAYYKQEGAFLQNREQEIAANKKVQDDELHAEWGAEYRANINAIENLEKTWSRDARIALGGAMDSDGFPLLNNKAFLKEMVLMSRVINPVDTVTTGGGGDQMASVETEIKAIEAKIGGTKEERDGYYKDEKLQKRYQDLLGWRATQQE